MAVLAALVTQGLLVPEVKLSNGQLLLIDDADIDLFKGYTWYAWRPRKTCTWYAAANTADTLLLAHHLILPARPDLEVDHINLNGLDNHRCNLRYATPSQNKANRPPPISNTSGFKGVSWDKRARKWHSYITVNGRMTHLGYYSDAWDAAESYNRAAIRAWGEFAYLNAQIGKEQQGMSEQ